jgi:hypothetical protein
VRVRLGMEASGQRCGIRDGNLPASYGLV